MKTLKTLFLIGFTSMALCGQNPSVTVGGQPNQDGLIISDSNKDGIQINNASAIGLNILSPGTTGISIQSPILHGLQISSAGNDGVVIVNSFDSGINVFSAGGHGGYFSTSALSPEAAVELKSGDDTKYDLKFNGHGIVGSQGNIKFYLDDNNNSSNDKFSIINSNDGVSGSISEEGFFVSGLPTGGFLSVSNNGMQSINSVYQAGLFTTQNTSSDPAVEISSGNDNIPDLRLNAHGRISMGGGFNVYMDDNNNGSNDRFSVYNGLGSASFWVDESGSGFINDIRVASLTLPAGYKMSVNGKIICEEVHVDLSGDWPDYVFENDYELAPLEALENQINEKGHLPGIPSAAEIQEQGLDVGEMQKLMMEKIEELTLHIIELNKKIKILESK